MTKKCGYKSYPRNKERRRRRKLSPDLYFASTVQTVFDYSAQQTLSQAWPTSIRRSGRIQAFLPSDRSHINLQDGWTEQPWVGSRNVDCDNWLYEGFRLHQPQLFLNAIETCGIEHEYISFLKRLNKKQKATVMTDKEDQKVDLAGWSAIQIAL